MHPSRFTLIAFLSWLHTLPTQKEVGRINHSRVCPLSNFLLAASGKASLVRTRTYQSPSWGSVEELPQWASQFTFLLDHVYMLDERNAYRPTYNVTVQQCVEVLSHVVLWETGAVLLRPHAYTPVLPFSAPLFSVYTTRPTPHVTRPAIPLGSVLFAPQAAPVLGLAHDDDLSSFWLHEVQ